MQSNYSLCDQDYFFGEAIIGRLTTRNLPAHIRNTRESR